MVVSGGKVLGTEVRHNEALTLFFLRNRLPSRYNPAKDIGPGHPVYEWVRADYEAERRREASDPERIRALHASIERKMGAWRAELEAKWAARRRERLEGDLVSGD